MTIIVRSLNTKSEFSFLIAAVDYYLSYLFYKDYFLPYKNELLLNDSLYVDRRYRSITSDENEIYLYWSSQLRANSHRIWNLKLRKFKTNMSY
jgi:hypothetical protein